MARGKLPTGGTFEEARRARDDELSAEDILSLTRHRKSIVREAVASRADLGLTAIIALASDDSGDVRAAIAANPVIEKSPGQIEVLAADKDARVLVRLTRNPAVPLDVVRQLVHHRSADVSQAAAHRLARPDDPHLAPPELTRAPVRGFSGTDPVAQARSAAADADYAPVRGFKPPEQP